VQIAEFVEVVASEVSRAGDRAVERWMAEINSALVDSRLTSLGRLQAVVDIVARYRTLTGKDSLPLPQRRCAH
jgi:hypothetical protein